MNKKSYILFILGLLISVIAAYYSIIGLSKLFAGAATAVIILASLLETAKLIITALLHLYWKHLSIIKYYLLSALIVLMLITSVGIYGFLSNAFQIIYTQDNKYTKKIELLETKIINSKESIKLLNTDKTNYSKSIVNISNSYANQNQELDKKTNILINKYSDKQASRLDNRINEIQKKINTVDNRIESKQSSVDSMELMILDLKSNPHTVELGPLKYLEELTGIKINIITNWLILIIIFVFDPLAIALLLSGIMISNIKLNDNTLTEILEPTKDTPVHNEVPVETSIDQLIDDTFNPDRNSISISSSSKNKQRNPFKR